MPATIFVRHLGRFNCIRQEGVFCETEEVLELVARAIGGVDRLGRPLRASRSHDDPPQEACEKPPAGVGIIEEPIVGAPHDHDRIGKAARRQLQRVRATVTAVGPLDAQRPAVGQRLIRPPRTDRLGGDGGRFPCTRDPLTVDGHALREIAGGTLRQEHEGRRAVPDRDRRVARRGVRWADHAAVRPRRGKRAWKRRRVHAEELEGTWRGCGQVRADNRRAGRLRLALSLRSGLLARGLIVVTAGSRASYTLLYSLLKGSLRLSSTPERALGWALKLSSRARPTSARCGKGSYRSCRKVLSDSRTAFVVIPSSVRSPAELP